MKGFILTFTLLASGYAFGQTLDDIELFNSQGLHGTPRYVSMGGAFTSLGNDFSAMHLNPASAGVYRKDNFGITLGFLSRQGMQQGFFGGNSEAGDFAFNIENVGYLKRFETGRSGKNTLAFGISYNKLNEFERAYTISGTNNLGSANDGTLAQYWLFFEDYGQQSLAGALGKPISEITDESFAAYQANVLLATNDTIDDFAFGLNGQQNSVSFERTEAGAKREIALTLGGEYDNFLSYGIALGFPSLSYSYTDRLSESGLPVDTFPYDATSYSLNRYNNIDGNGINIKLGMILRANQWLRVGASYQSPSWYTVDQVYEFEVLSNFDDGSSGESDLLSTGSYSYKLRTPAIYRTGLAFVFKKHGLISVDYEYSDPTQNEVYIGGNSNNVNESLLDDSNQNIQSTYTGSSTFRVGGELRLGPISARGGFNYHQSFYDSPSDYKTDQTTYSLGLGYQNSDFGVDIAYSNSQFTRQDFVHPFPADPDNRLVQSSVTTHNVLIGFTARF